MSQSTPEFQIYRSSRKTDDPPAMWVAGSVTWPMRIFLMALVCPIVIAFGGRVQLLWSWPEITRLQRADLLIYLPWVSAAMMIASRFVRTTPAAILCAASGLIVWTTVAFHTHLLIGLLLLAAFSVAVGNRVGKLLPDSKTPRVLTGIGGVVMLGLGLVSPGRTNVYGALLSGEMWQASWVIGLVLLATIGFAACGIAVAMRGARSRPGCGVSILSRAVLAGVPLALLGTRMSFPGLGGLNGFDVTAITGGFKVFGMSYMLLVITGLGLASLLGRWLGGGQPGDRASLDPDDHTSAPSPEPVMQG